MNENLNRIDDNTANLALKNFVLKRKPEDYVQLYQILFPRIKAALESRFAALPEDCRQDIVQDVFFSLFTSPEKVWNPNSGKPSNAFSILYIHAANRAIDMIRGGKRANEVELDEAVEKDIAICPPSAFLNYTPSVDEMGKVIKDVGLNDPIVADLKNPEFWEDGKAKPNYRRLADHYQTSVENMQQRVSRYRKLVLKEFTSKAGFLSIASKTFAMIRLYPGLITKSVILAGTAGVVILITPKIIHYTKDRPPQNQNHVSQLAIATTPAPVAKVVGGLKETNISDQDDQESLISHSTNLPSQDDAIAPTNVNIVGTIKNNNRGPSFKSDPSTDIAQDTPYPLIGRDTNGLPIYEGIPRKIIFVSGVARTPKKEQLETLLNKDSVASEFIEGSYPKDRFFILYHGYEYVNEKDMRACVEYVKNVLKHIYAVQDPNINVILLPVRVVSNGPEPDNSSNEQIVTGPKLRCLYVGIPAGY